MKIIVDSSVINQLAQTYGDKAAQALYTGINCAREEATLPGLDYSAAELYLNYETIVRYQKITSRKSVALLEYARDVLSHLNRVTGKNFRPVDANLKPIVALLKTYKPEEIQRVVENKTAKWKGTDFEDYLRPSTLFRSSNFEAYANEALAPEIADQNFANELDGLFEEKKV